MNNCTNVCGITVKQLRELNGEALEVVRPSGARLKVYLKDDGLWLQPPVVRGMTKFETIASLKKALREY